MSQVATQVDVPEGALCLGCNYPLRGLPEARCPECGQEFDPSDEWTMNLGRPMERLARRWRKPVGFWIDFWPITGALLFAVWWWRGSLFRDEIDEVSRNPLFDWVLYHILVLAWVSLIVAWSWIALGRRWLVRVFHQSPKLLEMDLPRRRFAAWIFLLSIFAAGWHDHDCFHADHFWWYGMVCIDHGKWVYQCPQISRGIHLFGNWYIHAS